MKLPNPGRVRLVVVALALCLLVAACGTIPPVAITPTATQAVESKPSPTPTPTEQPPQVSEKPFRIVGYVTDTGAIVSQIPFDKVTHINYAFLLPNADGTLLPISNPWKLADLVEAAHEHDVKVLISVGGWGTDPQFEALAADPAARARFVSGLAGFVDEYNLDGADIDWEYPDPDPSENNSARNFADLMRELSTEMRSRDKLLTAAVVALGSNGDSILSETFSYVNFLNIMVYDGAGEQHAPLSYAQEALDYWHNRGLPARQTVLGVPFYSRPHETPYRKLVEVDANTPYTDTIDYYGSLVNYNGLATMKQKAELALKRASGIMIWTLADDTSDDTSLLNTIYETAYGE